MIRGIRKVSGISLLVAFQVGTISALHRLGEFDFLAIRWADFTQWISLNPPEDTLAAILRVVALGCAYWLLISTLAYFAASLTRVPRLIAAVEWATLPAVRRLADRAAAMTLTAAALVGPAAPALADHAPPSIVFDIEDGVPTPRAADDHETSIEPPGVNGPGYTPTPAGRSDQQDSRQEVDTATDLPSAEPSEGPSEGSIHEVVRGDNLWCIAQTHIERTVGADVPTADVAAYWRVVIDANRGELISGDPDLIYPGEMVFLPSIEGARP